MARIRRIVFINQDSGYLMIDIINAYAELGYTCVLLTGRLVERNTPLHPSVKIERIIKYNRTTTFRRLFTWIWGFVQIWIKVVFKFRNDYLFIVSNPPLAPLLPLFVRNPFQLLIFDIYPDALTELGYLSENSLIIRFWRKSNARVYRKAGSIFTIGAGMQQVLQKYTGDKAVEIVTVWTSNTFLKPMEPNENPFIETHSLTGKFIVMYSGNIGLSGNVEVLLDIAARVKRDDIVFMIIGDGTKKDKIKEQSRKLNLNNIIFLPWQPVAELPFVLSAANIAVITLGKKASRLAVPSKLYNFLSVAAPLLCVTSRGSEIESLVNKYKCGKCFEPDEIQNMVNFIIELKENNMLCQSLKTNSLKASDDFNISNIKILTTTTSHVWKKY